MMALLDELMAKIFGARDELPIRVRADEDRPNDKLMKGRK